MGDEPKKYVDSYQSTNKASKPHKYNKKQNQITPFWQDSGATIPTIIPQTAWKTNGRGAVVRLGEFLRIILANNQFFSFFRQKIWKIGSKSRIFADETKENMRYLRHSHHHHRISW